MPSMQYPVRVWNESVLAVCRRHRGSHLRCLLCLTEVAARHDDMPVTGLREGARR